MNVYDPRHICWTLPIVHWWPTALMLFAFTQQWTIQYALIASQESFNMLVASRTLASYLNCNTFYPFSNFLAHSHNCRIIDNMSKTCTKALPGACLRCRNHSHIHWLMDNNAIGRKAIPIHLVMCQKILVMGHKVVHKKCYFLEEGTYTLTKGRILRKTILMGCVYHSMFSFRACSTVVSFM